MNLVKQIQGEFERLNVSTDDHPISGLLVEAYDPFDNDLWDESELTKKVKVYDEYESIYLEPNNLLKTLNKLTPEEVSLDSSSTKNIWIHLEKEYINQ